MANLQAAQKQLPIMVRKSVYFPTVAKNGMYLKDIPGDGEQPHVQPLSPIPDRLIV